MVAAGAISAGAAHAATDEARVSFTQGRAAFERNEFAAAQGYYEQALTLGMDGPAVHYNIGVAAFRAGDLRRAERAFHEVARTPAMAALAHYNLGLIALRRDDTSAARSHFEQVTRDSNDERLTTLAMQQLGSIPAPPPLDWSWYARGGAGHDDNVALRSDSVESAGSGEDDAFAELLVAASLGFGGHWRADAGVALLNYADLDEFDQGSVSLGIAREFQLGAWAIEPGAVVNQLTLDGDVYERSATLAASATRRFSGGRRLQARMRASSVNGEGDFSGLTGSRVELGARYDWSWQAWEFDVHARGELNDSEEELFATRWVELGARAEYAVSPRWSLLAAGTLRRTHHPEQPEVEEARNDRRSTLRLGALAQYWRFAQLFIRVEHERNDSPLDFYQYERNWVAVSLEAWY